VAAVPEARDGKWPFRQLWANGKRLTRARWPKTSEGRFQVVDTSVPTPEAQRPGPAQDRWRESLKHAWRTARFAAEDLKTFPDGKLPHDLGDRNAEVFALIGGQWATMRIPIEKVDGRQLATEVPMGYFTYYWGGMSMVAGGASGAATGHIENAMSLLAAAGQWYLDSKGGLVHYVPAEGEDPNAEEFIAPRLEQLLCLRGGWSVQFSLRFAMKSAETFFLNASSPCRWTTYRTKSGYLFTGSGSWTKASGPCSSTRSSQEAMVSAVTRNALAVCSRDQLRAARS
jgi:hypothetical protein